LKPLSKTQKNIELNPQTYLSFSTKNIIKKIKDTQNSKEQKDFQDRQKIRQQMKHRRFVK
jgi:hypothetical protein